MVERERIREGVDPIEHKRSLRRDLFERQDRITFLDAATAFLRQKTQEFRNAKHAAQWEATLREYAYPVLGQLPVDEVALHHVVSVLEPIWSTKTETAKRLRGRIENILSWATVSGFRSGENPARWRGHLDAVLPGPTKIHKRQHHPALPWQEIGAFIADLRKREGIGARALEFAILTAARSGEVRLAVTAQDRTFFHA